MTREEIELRPIYRVGQLYETVPGLVVTVHSGEGKANQYLLRGFNLDHGTDFANFVDDMPVNRPTNTHGQGYSDQNFLMPQIVGGLDYTKGPYYAAIGDFGAVGSAHVRLLDDLPEPDLGQRRHAGRRRRCSSAGPIISTTDDRRLGGGRRRPRRRPVGPAEQLQQDQRRGPVQPRRRRRRLQPHGHVLPAAPAC